MREFDDSDWKSYGFKKNHIAMIKKYLFDDELNENTDNQPDETSDISFDDDDDDDDDQRLNKKKQSDNNNESTTDFDDF